MRALKLIELDRQPVEILHTIDEAEGKLYPVRAAKMMLDHNSFVISAAIMKTHNVFVATLSLKIIVLGSLIKDDTGADNPYMHGGGFWGANFNMVNIGQRLHPHLALIDDFQGMEGAGPTDGTAVDHKVCIASLDWCVADHTAARLMAIDPKKMGYLAFAAGIQLGQSEPAKIDMVGETLDKHVKTYKLAPNIEDQYTWTDGPQRA